MKAFPPLLRKTINCLHVTLDNRRTLLFHVAAQHPPHKGEHNCAQLVFHRLAFIASRACKCKPWAVPMNFMPCKPFMASFLSALLALWLSFTISLVLIKKCSSSDGLVSPFERFPFILRCHCRALWVSIFHVEFALKGNWVNWSYRVVAVVAGNSEAVVLGALIPDTEYQLTVTAIWSTRKYRSRAIKFRTLGEMEGESTC